jgi:hypothetical protein
MIFPVLIVSLTTGLGFGSVWHQAFHEQALYEINLEAAGPYIVALAAPYLGLTFLTWAMHQEKDVHWPLLKPLEWTLHRLGRIHDFPLMLMMGILITIAMFTKRVDWLIFSIISWFIFWIMHKLNEWTQSRLEQQGASNGRRTSFWTGFVRFLMLELIDASFSLDSVSGAFAITGNFIAILIGLGVGALFVRAFTRVAVEQGTLDSFRYLEHGAHWSIGALAVILPLGEIMNISAFATGGVSVGIITLAVLTSALHRRKYAHS